MQFIVENALFCTRTANYYVLETAKYPDLRKDSKKATCFRRVKQTHNSTQNFSIDVCSVLNQGYLGANISLQVIGIMT